MENSPEGMFYSPADMKSEGIVGFNPDGSPIYANDLPMGTAVAADALPVPMKAPPMDENGNYILNAGDFHAAQTTDDPGTPSPGFDAAIAGAAEQGVDAYASEAEMREDFDRQAQESIARGGVSAGGVPAGSPGGSIATEGQPQMMASAPMAQQQQPQQPEFDRLGSFLGGMASAGPAAPYSGGFAQVANLFSGGSQAVRRDMAEMRKGIGIPSIVREYEYAKNQGYEGSLTDYKTKFGGNQFQQMMQMMQYQASQGARQDTQDYRSRQEGRAAEDRAYSREQDTRSREQGAEDRERKRRMGAVPSGYERIESEDGSYFDRPSVGSKDFVKAEEKTQVLYQGIGNINKMINLVKDFGSESYGENSTRMSSLYGDIIAVVAEAQNKGVIQAGEMEMIEKGITDPGDWKSHRKSNEAIIAGYKQVTDQLETKMNGMRAKYKRWGYEMPVDPAFVPGEDGVIDLP